MYLRGGTCFRKNYVVDACLKKPVCLAVRVLQVAERHATRRADRHARRLQALLDTVDTECALVRIPLRMDEAGVIRAGGDACFAAAALVMMHEHDAASFVNVAGAAGAAVNTRRMLTVIAPLAPDLHMQDRQCARGFVHDPVSVESFGDAVFRLASRDAIHASNAPGCVDDHPESRHAYASPVSKVTKFTFMPVPPISGSIVYLVINCESLAPFPYAKLNIFELCPNP